MSEITKLTQIITYQGPSMPLVNAAFLENVLKICRVNTNGSGYVSFLPGTDYPPFSDIEYGQSYIVLSRQVPYTIPDSPLLEAIPSSAYILTNDAAFAV